ncbi:MAG TPA: PQQ-binding-like beta-propeller repeat protein [Ktedonobacterales bacterium]|nr:PQQ-binding-like beta-propeller repeat protein [Ktedonobacterales bacterium]
MGQRPSMDGPGSEGRRTLHRSGAMLGMFGIFGALALLLTLLAGCAMPPLPDSVPAQSCVGQRHGTLGAGGVIVPLTALDPTSANHTSALYGVRANDGAIAWSCASTTYAGWDDAQMNNGVLYAIAGTEPTKDAPARTHVHAIYAIRPRDGAQLWSFSFRAGSTSRFAFDGGLIFVAATSTDGASNHSNLYAVYEATGKLAWDASFGDTIGQPVIVSHRILVPSARTTGQVLLAIDESEGSTDWSVTLPENGPPASWQTQGSDVYLSDGGALIAIDGASGAIRWTQQAVDSVSSPLFSAQRAILFSARMSVLSFDTRTGALRWSAILGAQPQLVAVRGQVAYALTQGSDGLPNALFALDVSTGDVLWQRSVSGAGVITPEPTGGADLTSLNDATGTLKLASVVSLDPHGRARWTYKGTSPYLEGALIPTSAALYYVWQGAPGGDTPLATYVTSLRPTNGAAQWTTALPALNAYTLPPLLAP